MHCVPFDVHGGEVMCDPLPADFGGEIPSPQLAKCLQNIELIMKPVGSQAILTFATRVDAGWVEGRHDGTGEMRMSKRALPLSKVYGLLETGPAVLLTTAHQGRFNVMIMSWHVMLEFEPPLVGCVVSSGDFSSRRSRRASSA